MNRACKNSRILISIVAVMLVVKIADAGLIHRYSFNDSRAKDSVGTIDATLKGDAKIAEGKLVLDNGTKVSNDPALSYLQFNSPVIPKSGSASLVVWITAKENALFTRVIDFGDTQNAEGFGFIYLVSRHEDEKSRGSITASDTGSKTYLTGKRLDDDRPHMAVRVIDGAIRKLHLYVDAAEIEAAQDLGENTLDKVTPRPLLPRPLLLRRRPGPVRIDRRIPCPRLDGSGDRRNVQGRSKCCTTDDRARGGEMNLPFGIRVACD